MCGVADAPPILAVLSALNLSNFAAGGPLPSDHIPDDRSFFTSKLAPFGTNLQFQRMHSSHSLAAYPVTDPFCLVLSCDSTPETQIRLLVNDGVTPLTGIEGCPDNKDGLCSIDTFVKTQKKIIANADWDWACHGDWEVPAGTEWNTTTGDVPSREEWQREKSRRARS